MFAAAIKKKIILSMSKLTRIDIFYLQMKDSHSFIKINFDYLTSKIYSIFLDRFSFFRKFSVFSRKKLLLIHIYK